MTLAGVTFPLIFSMFLHVYVKEHLRLYPGRLLTNKLCKLILIFVLQVSIGKQWKEFLDYNETIGFIFHVRVVYLVSTIYTLPLFRRLPIPICYTGST